MANKLIGGKYTTPDLVAKVTGKARYAEDWRVDGMLFCKLLTSPMPHARVKRLDTRKALAMPGVKAITTDDDLPKPAVGATLGEGVQATAQGERGLTMEPLYQGEPILALAATSEAEAAEAIEAIDIEFEPLPFVVDPIESLRPDGANARAQGNVWVRPAPAPAPARGAAPEGRGGRGRGAAGAPPPPQIQVLKWTDEDFRNAGDGQMPLGKATDEWTFGNLEDGFKKADLVLDETFMTQSTGHQPLETRTAMAYWQNGKLYLHGSTQSTMQTVASVARWVFPPAKDAAEGAANAAKVVIISEYTGGGFGSKIPGSIFMCIPALLSKKANAPVMMRITREEEHFIGRARPGFQGRMKVGFSKEGKITALDMFAISNNGPYDANGDANASGIVVSLLYQPAAMRWRGVTMLTNTPPRGAQSSPGGMQGIVIMETIVSKAARKLGL